METRIVEQVGTPKKDWVHFGITFAMMFFFRYLPAPEPITEYGMAIIGIFFGLIYAWSISSLVWPSLLALVAMGVSGYGNTALVYVSAFGNENWVLTILGFLMFGAIMESGVTNWVAIKLVTLKFTQGKPWLLVTVLLVGTLILATCMNGMILIIFLYALFADMFKLFGYKAGDKFVVMFLIGLSLASTLGCSAFPFKGWPLAPLGTVYKSSGLVVDNNSYMILVMSFLVFTMLAYALFMKLVRCDISKLGDVNAEELQERIKDGLSPRQKAISGLFITNIVVCIIVGIIGNKIPFIGALGVYGVLPFFMAIMILVKKEGRPLLDIPVAAKAVSWDMFFLYAAAMLIATLLTSEETGVSPFVMKVLLPIFNGLGEYLFLVLIISITLILTNIGNNLVVTFTMLSVVSMMLNQGVDFNAQVAVTGITVFGLIGVVLPASSVYGAMIHSNEMTTSKSSIMYGIMACAFLIVLIAVYFVPVGMMLF